MAIGNSAGILFTIKANNDDAKRAFNETERDVKGLSGAMGALGGPTALATAGLAAAGAAAVALAAGIARLTISTANYGSELYDASIQTGLTARSISALKLAADTSGSSLESVSGAVAKLNVLVGNAANGNEKAQATLKQYGITATTTNEAFSQAVEVIGKMTNSTERAAAMAALFKDRTGALGPVLDAIGGDFRSFTADAERLGLVLTEQDLKAADDFGDTLDILTKQAQAAGQQFALEFMPNVTNAMRTISGQMENNQSVARMWGRGVGDTIRGVELAFSAFSSFMDTQFAGLNLILGSNASKWGQWSIEAIASLNPVVALLIQLNKLGKTDPIAKMVYEVGDDYSPAPLSRTFSPGTTAAPKASKAPRDTSAQDAERARRQAEQAENARLDAIRSGLQREVAEKAQHNAYLMARLNADLAQGLVEEEFALRRRQEIQMEYLAFKIDQLEKEREARKASFVGTVEDEKRLTSEIAILNKEREEELEKAREENHKSQMRRSEEMIRQFQAEGKAILDLIDLEAARAKRDELASVGFERPIPPVQPALDAFQKLKESLTDLGPDGFAMQTLGQFAQGIGSIVQQFILMGSAGPDAMKKMVASVLASVAAQAAVQAIMFTAYGIAALTPWGAAIYGPAPQWFKAAAMMAVVAAAAGGAGRAIAGSSFQQGAGQATGSGGSGNGQGQQQNNFTTQFQGFGSQQSEAINQNKMVMAALVDELSMFRQKVQGMSPGDVVAIAADENPGAFRTGYESTLSDDARATDGLMRRIGAAR